MPKILEALPNRQPETQLMPTPQKPDTSYANIAEMLRLLAECADSTRVRPTLAVTARTLADALDGDTACSACRADIVRLVDEGVTPQAPPIQHAEVPEGPTNERVRYALDAIYNTLDAYCGGVEEKSSIDEWMQTIHAACLQTAGPMPEVREEDIAYFREGIERLDDNRMRRGLTETEERLRARLPRTLADALDRQAEVTRTPPMTTFDKLANEYGLDILTYDQRDAVLKQVHNQAHASRIAYDSSILLVGGGNLDHYAGLSYCKPQEVYKIRGETVKLYESDGEDQVQTVIEYCRDAVLWADDA